FFAHETNFLNWDPYQDFPNIAPPFPAFWMEYHTPPKLRFKGQLNVVHEDARPRVGLLCQSKPTDGVDKPYEWEMRIMCFLSYKYFEHPVLPYWVRIAITPEGTVYPDAFHNGFSFHVAPVTGSEFAKQHTPFMYPGLLAISFLHCKNVEIVSKGGPKSPSKKRVRTPQTKHYTLHIEPMKKVLRSEGRIETTGIRQALHICRGHFKDYSKGKGLFGQHQGLYWWESHVRGSEKEGKIEKSYAVHPPKQENDDE
ncbi:MAG TPA: hypothetical protein PK530_06910, partial [Anaerolineales bacterium]|nr:hypothetical protein [Anaerolineales bacterium]